MKKQIAFIVVLVLIVAIVLGLFSTKIAMIVTGNNLKKTSAETLSQNKDIKFWIDQVNPLGGFLKSVEIKGWAFDPSHRQDSEKHIAILLKAPGFYYETKSEVVGRLDVAKHYKDFTLNAKDLGVRSVFSTIALEDGEYELVLKVWQDNEEASYIATKRFFNKTGSDFIEIKKEQ